MPRRACGIVHSTSVVRRKITAGQDFKSLGSKTKLFVHSFVIGARDKRYTDLKAHFMASRSDFAAEDIRAPHESLAIQPKPRHTSQERKLKTDATQES